MRLVPVGGGAGVDDERNGQGDGGLGGVFHHPLDDGDGAVGPEDAVLALQIVAGRQTPNPPCLEAAVTTSGRIGLAEAVYALGVAASR